MCPRIVGATRRAADLTRDIDAGLERGPCGPQIRCFDLSPGELAAAVHAEIGGIDALLAASAPAGRARPVLHPFGDLIAEIERLAECARTYPDASTGDVPTSVHAIL
ncbi:MAG: hypothetical protein INR70_02075 [Parafilimonas terrae]|nr:hypothetical protein [Parafilimonas terrae]